MLTSIANGFVMGLSLIVAIGAQNSFILKQGLKQQHVFALCLCCALSDALLILAGVLGFSQVVLLHPQWLQVAKYLGAGFLVLYGAQHLYSAMKGGQSLNLQAEHSPNLKQMLLICLALTWLNPHVYLDTVLLLGAVSSQYGAMQLYFGLGAMLASFIFFFALGYGARLLQPIFAQARAWQILDALIGLIMWWIAYSLFQ